MKLKRKLLIICLLLFLPIVMSAIVFDNNYHNGMTIIFDGEGHYKDVVFKNSVFYGTYDLGDNNFLFINRTINNILIRNCKFIKGRVHLVDNIVLDGFVFDEDVDYYVYSIQKKYIYLT